MEENEVEFLKVNKINALLAILNTNTTKTVVEEGREPYLHFSSVLGGRDLTIVRAKLMEIVQAL